LILFILNIEGIGKKELIKSFFPISYNLYWFINAYIGIYIFFPFINKLIRNINKDYFKTLLIILFITQSLIPVIIPKSDPFEGTIFSAVYMYLIGAYIKIYNIGRIDNKRNSLKILISTYFCLFIIAIMCNLFTMSGVTYLSSRMKYFPEILISISMFMLFKNINLKRYSKVIELVSSSTLVVYLLHDNTFFRNILWNDIFNANKVYFVSPIYLISHIVICISSIFIIGILFNYIIKSLLEKKILKIKILEYVFEKIDIKMNNNYKID
jgi:surface polysaccharide O-acyltransferase-like enzyme